MGSTGHAVIGAIFRAVVGAFGGRDLGDRAVVRAWLEAPSPVATWLEASPVGFEEDSRQVCLEVEQEEAHEARPAELAIGGALAVQRALHVRHEVEHEEARRAPGEVAVDGAPESTGGRGRSREVEGGRGRARESTGEHGRSREIA